MNWAQGSKGLLLVCRDYEEVRLKKRVPLLLPPTWHKSFAQALTSVWDSAVQAIKEATRIIVVGFSMPVSDQHFKYLLSAGLQCNSSLRKVRIVDPKATSLADQYRAVFREDQFKYGVVSLCEKRTDQFFLDEGELAGIGRTLAHPGLSLIADDRRERRIVRKEIIG
ncbi:MAG TPA: hypothetical protein VN699_09070 [Pirellulales bacterium]|nr:hypothetical protein [Pirellulales bacterium]